MATTTWRRSPRHRSRQGRDRQAVDHQGDHHHRHGSPTRATTGVHGAPLGADETELTRKQLELRPVWFREAYDQFPSIDRASSKPSGIRPWLLRTQYPLKPPCSSGCCAVNCLRAGIRTCRPTPPKTVVWPPASTLRSVWVPSDRTCPSDRWLR